MKNIRFAVLAMLVAVAMTGCKDSNIEKTILSVTEVTESSISGKCAYTPKRKNDNGYIIFLCRTDNLSDVMREAMVEAYSMYEPLHESQSFTFDSLAADRTYYIVAVTYSKEKGEVILGDIKTLAQCTMASNDDRVTCKVTPKNITLTMTIDDNGYAVDLYDVIEDPSPYDLHVVLNEPTVVDTVEGTNCYKDGKIVCTLDRNPELQRGNKIKSYAYVSTGNESEYKKYEVESTLIQKTKFTNGKAADVIVGILHNDNIGKLARQ